MNYTISQKFFFDAAHTLKREIETDSSRRVHGHTYDAEVFLSGLPDPQTGMVMDLGGVRREVELLRIAPGALQLHTGTPGFAGHAGDALDFGGQQGFNARGAGEE